MNAAPCELSHPIRLERLGTAASTVTLQPDRETRAALAERFDLQAIPALRAELTVRRRARNGWIEVAGRLTAEVVQTCVVTTDPVAATVTAELLELFDDSGELADDEVVLDPLADTPEPIQDDVLDVGEIVAQAFGLALDPYPRVPGAEPEVTAADAGDSPTGSPFAGLAALKRRTVEEG